MKLDDLLLAIKEETDPADVRALLKAIDDTHGAGVSFAVASSTINDDAEVVSAFDAGIINAFDVPSGEPPTKIWFGLYYNTIVLMNGETGAGKSSLLYNIAIHAAMNKPLFDVPFGLGRPVRVLYIDPENAGNWQARTGGICGTKLDRLLGDRENIRDYFLQFHDGRGIQLENPTHLAMVKKHIKENDIDLVILDPIANLFATKDENDNSEAAKHMKALIELRQETGCCIIICHHQGKAASTGYGRGASARLSGADVGMMLNVRTDQEDEVDDDYNPDEPSKRADICRLRIIKNRVEDVAKASLFLAMAGEDQFRRVDFQVWKDTGKTAGATVDKKEDAPARILSLLGDGEKRTASQIKTYFASFAEKKKNIGAVYIADALKKLTEENALHFSGRPLYTYTLTAFTTLQTTKEDCNVKANDAAETRSKELVESLLGDDPLTDDEEYDEA